MVQTLSLLYKQTKILIQNQKLKLYLREKIFQQNSLIRYIICNSINLLCQPFFVIFYEFYCKLWSIWTCEKRMIDWAFINYWELTLVNRIKQQLDIGSLHRASSSRAALLIDLEATVGTTLYWTFSCGLEKSFGRKHM